MRLALRIVVLAVVALVALLALATTGCAPRVAGTDDVELTYEVEAEPSAACARSSCGA